MFNKTRYRNLERTLVIDSRVRSVTQFANQVQRRQSHAVGIPENAAYNQMSVIVTDKGYELPESLGLLYIDVAQPIKLQIGESFLTIEGQFTITGKVPPVVLISATPQSVNVIQY